MKAEIFIPVLDFKCDWDTKPAIMPYYSQGRKDVLGSVICMEHLTFDHIQQILSVIRMLGVSEQIPVFTNAHCYGHPSFLREGWGVGGYKELNNEGVITQLCKLSELLKNDRTIIYADESCGQMFIRRLLLWIYSYDDAINCPESVKYPGIELHPLAASFGEFVG